MEYSTQDPILIFSEGFAVACGLLMIAGSILLWHQHAKRPAWGLRWLAVAMALGGSSNLVSPIYLTASWRLGIIDTGFSLAALIALMVGFGSMAAIVIGIRCYILRPIKHVWLIALTLWIVPQVLVVVLAVVFQIRFAGDIVALFFFGYSGIMALLAARREPGVGHIALAIALFTQPLSLSLLFFLQFDLTAVRYISALPYAIIAMTLLSTSLTRMYKDLGVELQVRKEAQHSAEAAEEALRKSHDVQRAIIDNAPVPLAFTPVIDDQVFGSDWNMTWYKTFGYEQGSKNGQGGNDFGFYADEKLHNQFAKQLLQRGHVKPFEADVRHASGEVRRCLIQGIVLNSDDSRFIVTSYIDVTEQHAAELNLRKANMVNTSVARVQMEFIQAEQYQNAFNLLLDDILKLVDSEYGFIGQVLYNAEGQPYLKTFAISNIAWSAETQAFYDEKSFDGMEFTNLNTLFGQVMASGEVIIANEPATDPRRGGLPPGHPPLNKFLGIPVYFGKELVAMFGVANRPGGYDESIVEFLAPITSTIGQLVMAIHRARQQRETEQRLNSISNNLPNSMVYQLNCGKDGHSRRFTYISEGIEQLHGLSSTEAMADATLVYGQIHSDDLAIISAQEQGCVDNRLDFSAEYRGIAPNGEQRWYFISSTPSVNSDGEILFDGIEIDITERKTTELALHDERQRLTGILEGTMAGTWEWSLETQTLVFNERWAQMLGYTLRELEPCDFSTWQRLVHPDDLQPTLDILQQHLDGSSDFYKAEFRMQHKNKHWVWIQASGKILTRSKTGEPLVIRGTHLEITERKLAEQKLKELNTTLEARVRERTEELSQALTNLQHTQNDLIQSEKLAALGSLVAGIAHELNTPIGNAVTVSSTLNEAHRDFQKTMSTGLSRRALDEFEHLVGEASVILLRNLERAAGLINSFKQVAVDQNSHQIRTFQLREILSEVEVIMTPSLRKAGVSIHVECDPSTQLYSYPGALTQALMIVINNAIIHAFDNREQRNIHIGATIKTEKLIEIIVADDGIGVDPIVLKRIFEPFYTTKLGKGGSGLGMHIFYNLVTATLGGKTLVESSLGNGLTIRIELPMSALISSDQNSAESL